VAQRTLTQRELNRALLARQLLLERVRLPIPRALERLGGIQDQYAPNAYIRLWSCLENFRRDDLTRALERRSVVQATLMRATIHVVSKGDFWPFAVAIRAEQRDWWLRVHKPRPKERDLERQAEELRALMADGARRHDELVEVVGRTWGKVGPWLELVRVPPSGTWEKRRAHLFQTADNWVGREHVDPVEALDHLVRRYLAAFGPAARGDIAKWAGMRLGELSPAVERLGLRRFRDEEGGELVDVPRGPLPDPETPAPVRFLPTWDSVLLVHARRTGVLPERYRPLIFPTKMPQSVGTFLVDGSVAGTWRYENDCVRWDAFERLDRAAVRAVADEAERLAAFHT
jgi:DNA glycosylase AlkZ-like